MAIQRTGQREFFTSDEIAELYTLAEEMNELHDVCAALAAAREVAAVAKVAADLAVADLRRAAEQVTSLRAARTKGLESLGATLRVRELATLTRMHHSQVSKTLSDAEVSVPKSGRRGPQAPRQPAETGARGREIHRMG